MTTTKYPIKAAEKLSLNRVTIWRLRKRLMVSLFYYQIGKNLQLN
ncbi:hypothetical protein ENHAE0001_1033 [Enhydrobacter aerosaccus SK60]|nr:hypothetical protein ENHAE0001_1033 [Enhydrobacter aerosaccus SK60]